MQRGVWNAGKPVRRKLSAMEPGNWKGGRGVGSSGREGHVSHRSFLPSRKGRTPTPTGEAWLPHGLRNEGRGFKEVEKPNC